jgi:hypothetical protein
MFHVKHLLINIKNNEIYKVFNNWVDFYKLWSK